MPLYRCIYIDPKNGYINIARKSKDSFYQEKNHDILFKFIIQDNNREYKDRISNEIKNMKDILQEIKKVEFSKENEKYLFELINKKLQRLKYQYESNNLYEFLESEYKNYQEYIDSKLIKIKNLLCESKSIIHEYYNRYECHDLINLILLPIRFLVKHSAFEEESECRIVYLTRINDSKINYDEDTKKLYMEYKFMFNNISEIYLGSKVSENDKIILDYLCNKHNLDIKIKESKLPLA